MKRRIKIRNSSKVCDHDRIINTRKKIIRSHNPPPLFQREEIKKISKKIYEHSEEIASDIVEIIEDTYIFASGDIFSFIRKKIINTPINIISENLNSKIEDTGIYDKIKNEYDLKETEIITIKLIIKKIINEIIEYFAETIIKYIETKESIEWARNELYNILSKNINDYFSRIRKPIFDELEIRIPRTFSVRKYVSIPYKIENEIRNNKKNSQLYNIKMNSIKQKILTHNRNNNLKFLEEEHKYFIDNNLELISVTTKKQKFFPFKKEHVSREVAERNWTTEDEVLEEWSILAKNGSYIHKLAEKYCNKEKLSQEEFNKIQHVIKYFKEHPEYEVIATEIQIFSRKYQVAGTIDLIVKDNFTGRLFTIDWKTSRKDINKNDVWEMAKAPFENLPNNKFYQYSIQIWAYNIILKEEYNIEIWDSFIVHLKDDFKNYIEITPTQMSYEAEELLKL